MIQKQCKHPVIYYCQIKDIYERRTYFFIRKLCYKIHFMKHRHQGNFINGANEFQDKFDRNEIYNISRVISHYAMALRTLPVIQKQCEYPVIIYCQIKDIYDRST